MPGLTGEVANLIVALKLDDSGFSGKLNRAAGQLRAMDRGLSQMGRGVGQIGTGVGKVVDRIALATAGAGAFLVTTAASFEQSEASIRKTVDGTTDEVDTLIASIKDMTRTIPLSFEELAAITAEGGALGIATENLDDFTDIVARLAVSTDLSAEQASTALGQLANVLGLTDADLRDFADSLVALGNDGASTESQILDMTARFGSAGRAAGLTNEQILALASSTASMGIEAEAGGGALSRIFQNLTVDMATASDEGKLLAETLDLSLAELMAAWEHDAGGVFEQLLSYINQLDQFEAAAFLSDLGITNTRDINAIRNLATNVEEYQRQLGVAEGQTDELNRESDAFFNTTEGKWKTTVNSVRLAADTIGGKLLPIVNELLEDFTGWLDDPKTQRGIEEFATNLADGVRDVVREIRNADFGPLLDTLKGAASIAKGAFDAFMGLPADLRNLLLGFIAVNKVTGGAVGDITKGLGNLVGGGLKVALAMRGSSPANPLYVMDVSGGLGGAPGRAGRGGGGFLPLLGTAGLAATALAIGTAVGTEIHRSLFPAAHEFNELLSGTKGRPASFQLAESQVNELANQLGMPVDDLKADMIPLLQEGNMTWTEILAAVRENGKVPEPTKAPEPRHTITPTIIPGTGGFGVSVEWPDEASRGFSDLARKVDMLPDTSMLAPAVNALTNNLPPIQTNTQASLSNQAQALSAARTTNSEIGRLANTPHNVNVDNQVNVGVNVGVSVLNQYVYRQRVATGFSESTLSGGI